MRCSIEQHPFACSRSASAPVRRTLRAVHPLRAVRALRPAAGAAALLLAGCSGGVLDPRGRVGMEERSLILTAAALMLIVVVPVIVLTITFAVRYRASSRKAVYRADWSHSRPLEIVVWVVPCLIVGALGYLAWTRSHSLDPFRPLSSAEPPVSIQVVSLDWKWLFIYPAEHVASVNEVAFPVGTPVDFSVTSDTVMNSFFIPQLGSQIYSMAGMRTQLHLEASTPGRYAGLSANFSGDGFSRMRFAALALSAGGYRSWLERARRTGQVLDWSAYRELAAPSENAPVRYFSGVQAGLFNKVVDEYADGPPMRMSALP